jgi:hypothetical protein
MHYQLLILDIWIINRNEDYMQSLEVLPVVKYIIRNCDISENTFMLNKTYYTSDHPC